MESTKKLVSNILSENREWHDCNTEKPPKNTPVVFRFTNNNIIYGEDETSIYPAEDIKIGILSSDDEFVISGPFPRFDFSPLSNRSKFTEGTIVTHWAYPEEGEVEAWKTRFDPFHTYKNLSIEVDGEHIKDVYRALLVGASALSRLYGLNPSKEVDKNAPDELKDLDNLYKTLCDLQAYIDNPSNENFNKE